MDTKMKKVTNFSNNQRKANKDIFFSSLVKWANMLSNANKWVERQVLSYSADGNIKLYNLSRGQFGNIYQKPLKCL